MRNFLLFSVCLFGLATAATWIATDTVPVSQIAREVEDTSLLRHRHLQETLKRVPELIANSFVLGDTERYVVLAGLADDLNAPDVTFFFPWDNAWRSLDSELITRLRSAPWRAHLVNLILYHLYQGVLPPDAIEIDGETGSASISMANGETVLATTTLNGARIRVNDVRIIAESEALNGYAYMLDDVLRPAWISSSLSSLLTASSSFPTLLELLVIADLDGILDTQSDPDTYYTVFCPSEAAWANLTMAELAYLRSPDGLSDLSFLLGHHVVPSSGPIPVLLLNANYGPITTLSNSSLVVNQDSPELQIEGPTNTVDVIQGDAVVAFNGIAHVISDVLWLPPAFCSVNPVCNLLDLDGLCCETVEGVLLDCCDPPRLCVDNPGCLAEGLLESCCPTDDGVFLECCAETLVSSPSQSPSIQPTGN